MADVRRGGGEQWRQRGDVLVAVFVCVAILMLLIPLPGVLLDLFMLLNICLSLLVILIVLYARNTLEFTVFPTLLLLATVFGLALNVSSTRLILAQGAVFDGRVVRAFGSFVVGASGVAGYLIGLVIFTIIIAVQFVVITKGSTRVAEVAARFTLDALPGRQMAIDAEYHAGLLTEVSGSAAQAGAAAAEQLLRRHGRCFQVRLGQCPRSHSHHAGKPRGWSDHGGERTWRAPGRGGADLCDPDHRRWPRDPASGAAGLHRYRHRRHASDLRRLVRP